MSSKIKAKRSFESVNHTFNLDIVILGQLPVVNRFSSSSVDTQYIFIFIVSYYYDLWSIIP